MSYLDFDQLFALSFFFFIAPSPLVPRGTSGEDT